MSQRFTYAKPAHRLGVLHEALLAAGITPQLVEGTPADIMPQQIWITVADGVAKATVDAVVNAHDPAVPSPTEQQAAQDATDIANLAAVYTSAVVQIENDRTQIANGLTSLTDAQWTGLTQAQRGERLRTVQQGVLNVLDNSCVRERVMLRALRAIVRRLGA